MKNNKKNIVGRSIIIICLLAVVCLALSSCIFFGDGSNPYLPTLDIDITLNTDGSISVYEKHVIQFDHRGDEWWNYYKTVSKFDEDDDGVKNTGNVASEVKNLSMKIDGLGVDVIIQGEDPDDLSPSGIARLRNSGYLYERDDYYEVGAYFAPFSEGQRTVEFSYDVTNVMVQYKDVAGFYYQFVAEDNEMDYNAVNATVRFGEWNRESLLVWTHLDLGNGEGVFSDGEKVSSVNYVVEDLPAGYQFETRILFPSHGYVLEKFNSAWKEDIVKREQGWYDEYQNKLKTMKIVEIADYVLIAGVVALTVFTIVRYKKKRKPLKIFNAPIYIRETPEDWSAAEVAPVYHYYGKYEVGDSISATMLQLVRKKFIKITPIIDSDDVTFTVLPRDTMTLLPHERTVYNMLSGMGVGTPFTSSQFEKVAKKNFSGYAKIIEEFKILSSYKANNGGYLPKKGTDKEKEKITSKSTMMTFGGIVLAVLSVIFSDFFVHVSFTGIALAIGGLVVMFTTKKDKQPLNEAGQTKYEEFHALGRFLSEFSNLDRHELPALVMWEEYMVYATAMGIADKVSEQLEIAYPELKEKVAVDTNSDVADTMLLWYLLSPSYRAANNLAFIATINDICRSVTTMQRNATIAANAKKFASSSGRSGRGGGGFSGGGGGFGGGGSHAR